MLVCIGVKYKNNGSVKIAKTKNRPAILWAAQIFPLAQFYIYQIQIINIKKYLILNILYLILYA